MASIFSKIPEEVIFPYEYRCRVCLVDVDDPNLEGRHATWDVDTQTVYITKSLPIAEKRWCFEHELGHAWNDWWGWVQQNCKVRAPEEGTDEEENGGEAGSNVGH